MTLKSIFLYLSARSPPRSHHADWQKLISQNAYLENFNSLAMFALRIPVQKSTNAL